MAQIVLLHYSAPPVVGGVESIVGTHARLLRGAGYEVRILAGRGRGGRDVPVTTLPLLSSRHPEILSAHAALHQGDCGPLEVLRDRIADYLAPHLEDGICLVHNVFTLAKNLPLTAALHKLLDGGLRGRVVAWTHDLAWANRKDAAQMRDAYPWSLLRTARSDVVYVAITQAVRDLLVRHLGVRGEDVTVVYTGTSLEAMHRLQPRTRRILKMLSWSERFPVLLMPVRITRRKNLELAIRIAAALRGRGIDPLVVITGPLGAHNPTNRKYLAELRTLRRALGLDDHVCFLAERGVRCSNRVIGDLYLLSDAVLITSTLEGFGMPVAEAGMLRTPVFCARIPAAVEVGGQHVAYFDLDDAPAAVAEQIVTALQNSAATQLRRRVQERFTWEAILRGQILPLLERLQRTPVAR